jgi:hypothetical protein
MPNPYISRYGILIALVIVASAVITALRGAR